jgi:hypothetical protein
MLGWLYDIFVAIVSFIMGLFGFDLKKRSVTFADEIEKKDDTATSSTSSSIEETKPDAEAAPVTE